MNKKDYKELSEDIKDFISARHEKENFSYMNQRKYKKILSKSSETFNKITKFLKNEDKHLLNEYENLSSQILEIHCEEIYKKGFQDCANILSMIFNNIPKLN